ncbi:MAG: hypothetical protein EXS55_02020 [Candidatus Magasanikbacteria bacterium]|nr:hypothetical protein [Candidatus Magasanikbacteria bacterium]
MVAAAAEVEKGEKFSLQFHESKDKHNKERITELEDQLKNINDFLYGMSKTYPFPVAHGEQPKSKQELVQIAKEIGDELRELKKIK